MPPSSSAWNLLPNRITILALITLFAPGCAFAMDRANAPSQSDRGIGFAPPLAGMTAAAVEAAFPALSRDSRFRPSHWRASRRPATCEGGNGCDSSPRGCSSIVTLMFFRVHLDHVAIVTEKLPAACHQKIEDRLIRRYREPNRPASCPNIIHRSWKDAAQTVTYDYDCSAPNNRLNIQFHQDGDSSGRKLADRKPSAKRVSASGSNFFPRRPMTELLIHRWIPISRNWVAAAPIRRFPSACRNRVLSRSTSTSSPDGSVSRCAARQIEPESHVWIM